jgi:hypothetical protein
MFFKNTATYEMQVSGFESYLIFTESIFFEIQMNSFRKILSI